jgi:hypothetical protein
LLAKLGAIAALGSVEDAIRECSAKHAPAPRKPMPSRRRRPDPSLPGEKPTSEAAIPSAAVRLGRIASPRAVTRGSL